MTIYYRKLTIFVIPLLILQLLTGCSTESEPAIVSSDDNASEDYVSAEMRSRINQLVQSVGNEPTSESTIAERADLLADWIDAYALAGGEVGLDAPRVRLQATLPPTGNAAATQSRNVDRFRT